MTSTVDISKLLVLSEANVKGEVPLHGLVAINSVEENLQYGIPLEVRAGGRYGGGCSTRLTTFSCPEDGYPVRRGSNDPHLAAPEDTGRPNS